MTAPVEFPCEHCGATLLAGSHGVGVCVPGDRPKWFAGGERSRDEYRAAVAEREVKCQRTETLEAERDQLRWLVGDHAKALEAERSEVERLRKAIDEARVELSQVGPRGIDAHVARAGGILTRAACGDIREAPRVAVVPRYA